MSRHLLSRPLRIGAMAVLTVLLGCSAALVAVENAHPRDDAAFLQLVRGSSWTNGARDFDAVDDATLLAEGDRACAWLGDQPPALWRRGGEWSADARVARYQREVPAAPEAWALGAVAPEAYRAMVVSVAWAHLCGADLTLRGTHNPFNRPPHD